MRQRCSLRLCLACGSTVRFAGHTSKLICECSKTAADGVFSSSPTSAVPSVLTASTARCSSSLPHVGVLEDSGCAAMRCRRRLARASCEELAVARKARTMLPRTGLHRHFALRCFTSVCSVERSASLHGQHRQLRGSKFAMNSTPRSLAEVGRARLFRVCRATRVQCCWR